MRVFFRADLEPNLNLVYLTVRLKSRIDFVTFARKYLPYLAQMRVPLRPAIRYHAPKKPCGLRDYKNRPALCPAGLMMYKATKLGLCSFTFVVAMAGFCVCFWCFSLSRCMCYSVS